VARLVKAWYKRGKFGRGMVGSALVWYVGLGRPLASHGTSGAWFGSTRYRKTSFGWLRQASARDGMVQVWYGELSFGLVGFGGL
jgi:hypothetical protein